METFKTKGRPPKWYTITQGGVLIKTLKNPSLPTEELVPFENIKSDRFYYRQKFPMLLILSAAFLMVYILILADAYKNHTSYHPVNNFTWPGITLLFTGTYFFLQPKVYFLKTFTGKFIKFNIRKNEQEIAAFIKKIVERRNEYIRVKYGTPSLHLPYDAQFSNFKIMARENMISPREYQEKIAELNRLFNQTAPVKTFLGYSDN